MGDLTLNEMKIAERFLFLDNAIDVLEAELKGLGDGSFKIKEAYIDKVTKAIYVGQLERQELRQEMKRLEIKVEHDKTTDHIYRFIFLAGKRFGNKVYDKNKLVFEVRKVMYQLLGMPESDN